MKRVAKFKLLLTVALFIGTSVPSVAQGPGWTAVSTVTRLVVTHDGGINIALSPELTNCVSNSGYGSSYASIYPAHPGLKQMKADLLVAFTTGAKVALYLGDANCTVTEMMLIAQ